MDKKDKELIRTNYRALAKHFSTDMDEICYILLQKKVLSELMKGDILAKNTPLSQAYEFLDLIVRRGPTAFGELYAASKEQCLYGACDILMPDNAPHEPRDEASSSDELEDDSVDPEREKKDPWLADDYIQNITGNKFKCGKVRNMTKYESHIKNASFYQMTGEKRGQLLVLSNKSMHPKDRKILDCLCTQMNFATLIVKVIAPEKSFSDCLNTTLFSQVSDCLVLFIMTTKALTRKDWEDVMDILKNNVAFAGKPKVIFRMAQKLGMAQEEVEIEHQLSAQVDGFSISDGVSKESDIIDIQVTDYGCQVLDVGDVKITRFIHIIVDVFFKHAKRKDIYGLMREVNLRSEQVIVKVSGTTSRKELFFFPGCPQNNSGST